MRHDRPAQALEPVVALAAFPAAPALTTWPAAQG